MSNTNTTTFDLFPVPSNPPSVTSPARWAGITPESTKALRDVLKDNHERWHIYFDEVGRHNHITHHVLALWAMGAHKEIIEASYKKNTPLQRPIPDIPEPITPENFNDHLGKKDFYLAYIEFFTKVVREKGMGPALEEYVFSSKVNVDPSNGQAGLAGPGMLNRFFAALFHSYIQVGYAVEFGLPGMMIEGLAETATHKKDSSAIFTNSFFNAVWNALNSSLGTKSPSQATSASKPPTGIHSFTIVARILKDDRFILPQADLFTIYSSILTNDVLMKVINEYVSQWTVDTSNPKEVERKIEELQWLSVLLYALPGADTKGVEFNADFLNMHLVTASLFLPSLVTYLSPMSQELLLRGYLSVSLSWWIGNSRPTLNIPQFFALDHTSNPLPPSSPGAVPTPVTPTPHSTSSPRPKSPISTSVNPWLPLIQQVISHPDDHYSKTMRALAHYSSLYGSREPGYFSGTELWGAAEFLDGTLFVRTAALTARRLEETEPDEYLVYFDRMGYYGNRKS